MEFPVWALGLWFLGNLEVTLQGLNFTGGSGYLTAMLGTIGTTVGGAVVIVVVGSGLGLTFNALRPGGLPLSASVHAAAAYEGAGATCTAGPATKVPEIALAEARKLYGKPRVSFVDARDEADYRRGHVKGAILLPYRVAAEVVGKSTLPVPRNHRLIVYCNDDCTLSDLLAQVLSSSGCDRVRVMRGGYPAWAKAGLPSESGP